MSQSDWKDRIEKTALDILWSHWIKLGAYVEGEPCRASGDPEALILLTCLMAPIDRRLPEVMRQWLNHYECLVNVERLKTAFKFLTKNRKLPYDGSALRRILEDALPASSLKRWERFLSLLADSRTVSSSWGSKEISRETEVDSRKKLQIHDRILKENPLLEFRYAFGATAKADILHFLNVYSSQPVTPFYPPATGTNIAKILHYDAATVSRALNDLEDSQLILSKDVSSYKVFLVNSQGPLLRWLPKTDRFFLHWFALFDVFLQAASLQKDVVGRHETVAIDGLNVRLQVLDHVFRGMSRSHPKQYAVKDFSGVGLQKMWEAYGEALKEIYNALVEPRRLDWMSDDLTCFLDTAQHNLFGSYVNLEEFRTVMKFDRLFNEVIPLLSHQKNWVEGVFFVRAHSSYRAAARLAGSGQLREAFSLMRAALEDALYALHIHRNPASFEIWLNRQDDKKSKKACKKEFKIAPFIEEYEKSDLFNGPPTARLYQLTIDYGAHPNVYGYLTNLEFQEEEKTRTIHTLQLNTNDLPLRHAVKSVAQTGVCCLLIFENIFRERFQTSGLSEKLRSEMVGL